MEKARSLLEAEANLDDMEEDRDELAAGHAKTPSGFVPASASPRGHGAVGGTLSDMSDIGSKPPRAASASESGVFAGIPSGSTGERLLGGLQGALGAAARNESAAGSLHRAIRDASRAFTASRQAQEAVAEELRVVHRGLNELMSEKAAIERYAALLTQERDAALDAAEEARREAKRDREFLLREQDRFIQLLLEEHEAELQRLRRAPGPARATSATGIEAAEADAPPATVPGIAPTSLDQPAESRASSPGESLGERRSTPPGEAVGERQSTPPGEAFGERQSTPGEAFGERPSTPPGEAFGERRSAPPGELIESRRSAPPGELTGAALARYALASPLPAHSGFAEPVRAVPLPADHGNGSPEAAMEAGERMPTYPPAPTVLDLDSLAAEIDGNSERPPPIRRQSAEPVLHLKPARVPTQLYDTLVSQSGEPDPNRKG